MIKRKTYSIDKRISLLIKCLSAEKIKKACKMQGTSYTSILQWKRQFIEGTRIFLKNEFLTTTNRHLKSFRKKQINEHLEVKIKLLKENKLLEESINLIKACRFKKYYSDQEKILLLKRFKDAGVTLRMASVMYGVPVPTVFVWNKKLMRGTLGKRKIKPRVYESKILQNKVFALLHEPPSNYGLNRTSWRLRDLESVLRKKGVKITLDTIQQIIKEAGYKYRKAKTVLTSNDLEFRPKLQNFKRILRSLGEKDLFFSIDEYGPFVITAQGGRSWTAPGERKQYLWHQKTQGRIIVTAALELKTNQVTHFYSKTKDSKEMLKLIRVLRKKYPFSRKLYLSWDAASWHSSNVLNSGIAAINNEINGPKVELVPLPTNASFLNLIESIFSGMARAIIHNSNYSSKKECTNAINRYFRERNRFFVKNPKKAGNTLWGKEQVCIEFKEGINCKHPKFQTSHYIRDLAKNKKVKETV